MGLLGRLVVEITGDSTKLDKSIDRSQNRFQKFSKFVGRAAPIVGAAIVGIGVASLKAASDAEETESKFNTVFSGLRKQAQATAKSLSENYGLSQKAAQQLLGDTGDLLTGFGFTQEAALDLSNQVNTLAVDLASFTNFSGGAEGASAALTKALLGERESIKSLGIAITEADINRLAEDKGIVGELTRQEKAALTLEIAISQSKNAIGDFERTQASFANQSRVLTGRVNDVAVSLGKNLLPAASFVTAGINDFLLVINDLLTDESDLEGVTRTLTEATNEYKTAVTELEEKAGELSETEKTVLETRRQLAKAEILKTIVETAKAFEDNASATGLYTSQIRFARQDILELTKGLQFLNDQEERGISNAEFSFKQEGARHRQRINRQQAIEKLFEFRLKESKAAENLSKADEQRVLAISAIANALNAQIVTTADLIGIDEDLQAQILNRLEEIQKAEAAAEKAARDAKGNREDDLKDETKLTEEELKKRAKAAEDLAKAMDESFKKSADALDQYQQDVLKKQEEQAEEAKKRIEDVTASIIPHVETVTKILGETIAAGAEGWEVFKEGAKDAIATVIEGFAKQFAVQAGGAFATLNFPLGIALSGASAAAFAGAAFVRALAEGGVVTGPTPAIIGEAGREAVLPLTNQDVMADLANQITRQMPINNIFEPTNNINFPNQLMLNIEGKQINAYITEASRNGRILIDSNRGIT